MADIFISYSKQEAGLTTDLAAGLEQNGYTTWWDTSLKPGDEFRERITDELDSAKVVIVIWTAFSVASRWVQAEAQWAAAQNKLITVRSADLHPDRIPLPFNTRHTDLVTDLDKILGALLRYNLLPPLQHKPENRYELGRASDFHAQTATRVGAGQAFHRATGIWRLVHPFAGLDSRVRRRHLPSTGCILSLRLL